MQSGASNSTIVKKQVESELLSDGASKQPGPLARCERSGSATEQFHIGEDDNKLVVQAQQRGDALGLQRPTSSRSLSSARSQKRRSEQFEGVAQSLHEAATA